MPEGYEVDTDSVRKEGGVWFDAADEMAPIRSTVANLELGGLAFFTGIADAGSLHDAYEGFRSDMDDLFDGAITEFEVVGIVLRDIADSYDENDDVVAAIIGGFVVDPDDLDG
jgi:hypothetical protein